MILYGLREKIIQNTTVYTILGFLFIFPIIAEFFSAEIQIFFHISARCELI